MACDRGLTDAVGDSDGLRAGQASRTGRDCGIAFFASLAVGSARGVGVARGFVADVWWLAGGGELAMLAGVEMAGANAIHTLL